MDYHIPLTPAQFARLSSLKRATEVAQREYGIALGILIDGTELVGAPTRVALTEHALLISGADVPPIELSSEHADPERSVTES